MAEWFMFIRSRGPNWDRATPMRKQKLWPEHVVFVNALEADGVIRLAGPLGSEDGAEDVLLICRGDSADAVEDRLRRDPWTAAGMLATTRISPWNMLVGRDELEAALALADA